MNLTEVYVTRQSVIKLGPTNLRVVIQGIELTNMVIAVIYMAILRNHITATDLTIMNTVITTQVIITKAVGTKRATMVMV